MKNFFRHGLAVIMVLMMVSILAACGTEEKESSSKDAEATGNGWYSSSQLSTYGLSGLKQPNGTDVRESSDTNVQLTGMTEESYKAWVADAFALVTEKHGAVYEAQLDDSMNVGSFTKISSLTAADVSTDELPSFDIIYKNGDETYSLYILYYPVDYLDESAGYAEVRIANMTSEWGELPFLE